MVLRGDYWLLVSRKLLECVVLILFQARSYFRTFSLPFLQPFQPAQALLGRFPVKQKFSRKTDPLPRQTERDPKALRKRPVLNKNPDLQDRDYSTTIKYSCPERIPNLGS